MHKIPLMICLKNPFKKDPLILARSENGDNCILSAEDILKFDKIIGFDFSTCIDSLRSLKELKLPFVIDICTAKKLVAGKQKKSFRVGAEPWNLRKILEGLDSKSKKWLNDFFLLKISDPPSTEILHSIMNSFQSAWDLLHSEMIKKNEDARFYEVEAPIYNLFLKTQLRGILVPKKQLMNKLHELKEEQYSNFKKLEFDFGFISQWIKAEMKWTDIEKYCNPKTIVIKDEIEYDFWQSIEIYSEYDPFLRALLSARNAFLDYNALIKYAVNQYDKIYPQFDVMGTVTGRILVSSPGVQYLKKTSRSIFSEQENNKFIYADFDQFEPGIIASLSNDQKLIELYNSGDVYEELSKLLFAQAAQRKIAKLIFLSYIYGMSIERLKQCISNIAGNDAAVKGMIFFDEFKQLCQWKDKVCKAAAKSGFAESYLGNRRYLNSQGNLLNSEKRWIPNQIVQGTASYIFKKSILEVYKIQSGAFFLIPMHDAILIEVHEENEAELCDAIKKVFCSTFEEVCPKIKANITFEDFSTGKALVPA